MGGDFKEDDDRAGRPARADAQRNLEALLEAAATVFATSGVDAPIRQIAAKAGVGVATLYRHFPQRSDLIAAIVRRGIDSCADAGRVLSSKHPPTEALARWMQRYVDLIATKRGLATALHSGDPAYQALPAYFEQRLKPTLRALLDNAVATGEIRGGVEADDLLRAVPSLCMSAEGKEGLARTRRMVALLVDGLRYGALPSDVHS